MLFAALLLAVPPLAHVDTGACRAKPRARGAFVYLEREKVRGADSVVALRLCLLPPRAAGVGSFHLQVVYDSLRLRGARVSGTGAFVVANPARPGTIELAGANPRGFPRGALARIELRTTGRTAGNIGVTVLELNSTSGANLRPSTSVAGIEEIVHARPRRVAHVRRTARAAAVAAAAPHVDSIVPSHVHASPGVPIPVRIFGKAFTPTGNHILLGDQAVAVMDSPNGTTIAVVLSPWLPSHGEVPPRQLVAGSYPLRVRTDAGPSNAAPLIVETP